MGTFGRSDDAGAINVVRIEDADVASLDKHKSVLAYSRPAHNVCEKSALD